MYAWRSVYWSEQVSTRTRALLMFDWIIRCVPISSFAPFDNQIDKEITGACGVATYRDYRPTRSENLGTGPVKR
jgi:hypothetical protein